MPLENNPDAHRLILAFLENPSLLKILREQAEKDESLVNTADFGFSQTRAVSAKIETEHYTVTISAFVDAKIRRDPVDED